MRERKARALILVPGHNSLELRMWYVLLDVHVNLAEEGGRWLCSTAHYPHLGVGCSSFICSWKTRVSSLCETAVRTTTSSPERFGANLNVTYVPLKGVSVVLCARRWREALGLRDRMVAEGIKPDGYSFNALIEACSKGGQVKISCSQADRQMVLRGPCESTKSPSEWRKSVFSLAAHFFLFQAHRLTLRTYLVFRIEHSCIEHSCIEHS